MTDLDTAYVDWKSWDSSDFGRFDAAEGVYFAAETAIAAHPAARVLEIGFGNGAFLGWVRSVGGEVYGIEANPSLNDRARAFLGADRVFDSLDDAGLRRIDGTLSHVVAFDVIEHVPMDRLPALLTRVRDLLGPGGRVLVRFPNGDSPFGRISQHGDPTHVTTLGYQRLEFFARAAGLRVEEIRAPRLPAHGVGLSRNVRRWMLKAVRAVIERAVGMLYYGGRRIALDPNYVAVLSRADAPAVMPM